MTLGELRDAIGKIPVEKDGYEIQVSIDVLGIDEYSGPVFEVETNDAARTIYLSANDATHESDDETEEED